MTVHQHAAPNPMPRPLDEQPGEPDDTLGERRAAWLARLHRHAPGLDWRAQDASFRTQRRELQQRERQARLAAGASKADLLKVDVAAVSGAWVERGSSNLAGRVTATLFDATADRLTVLAQGGQVWRANRATPAWMSSSDAIHFDNSGHVERLAGASGERLLVASDNPIGIFRSDDGGSNWELATGPAYNAPWYAMGVVTRDAAMNDVYALRVAYDSTASAYRPYLSVSSDRGERFVGLGFVGVRDRTALFSPRYDSSEVYLLADTQLQRIVPGTNALSTVSTVPLTTGVGSGDLVVLRGGVSAGQVFLYAFYSRSGSDQTEVFRSLDGGTTWAARTPVPSILFGPNAAQTSPRDPALLYAGGVNAYRSADGGETWTKVNDWPEYYANPAARLHADIRSIEVWTDGANAEHVFFGTDGGLFESTDSGTTVQNLSSNGLRVSQYYGSYTRRVPPYSIVVGSQDQGYQKAVAPTGGIETFDQAASGDFNHLCSSDGGATVWMVYPGFVLIDTTTTVDGRGGLRSWSYDAAKFHDWLFFAPIAADPQNPHHASLAGGNLNSAGHHVEQLTLTDGSVITAAEDPFDFGAQVTAIAYSATEPSTRYAINDDGAFFRDTGSGWTMTATGLPGGQYFSGNTLLADPVVRGRIYVGGSGYSNPAVYVSTDNGATFQPMSTGLPNTLVYSLAISPDGTRLFAATELGPYYFDRQQNNWIDLTGLGAPDQIYWDVDYVAPLNIARFSTYGRGLWDFVSADQDHTGLLPINQHGLSGHWYSPATSGQGFSIEVYPDLRGPGKGLLTGGWFSYAVGPAGAADHQRWWSLEAAVSNERAATPITIYRNVGGNFDAPPITTASVVGSGSLKFTSCRQAVLDYQFTDGNPRSGSITLSRLAANIECSDSGAAATTNADFAYSGNWYDPSTAGQGFIFEVNPVSPVLFATWYSYAPASTATADAERQRWFTLQTGDVVAGRRQFTNVPIYLTTGGSFDRAPTADQTTVQVGTADVRFTSCSSASVTYRFQPGTNAGRSGTIALTRVGPAPASCR